MTKKEASRTTNGRGRLFDNVLDTIGDTPAIRINNLGVGHAALYVKAEFFNPAASVKDRLAIAIIEHAERSGALRPGQSSQIRPAILPKAKAGQIAPLAIAINAAPANKIAGQRAKIIRRRAPPTRTTNNNKNRATRARRTGVSTGGHYSSARTRSSLRT